MYSNKSTTGSANILSSITNEMFLNLRITLCQH